MAQYYLLLRMYAKLVTLVQYILNFFLTFEHSDKKYAFILASVY